MLRAGIVVGLISLSQIAWADPSASDRATARALAGEGYAALKKKDYATAEDRFRRANELIHAPTLVVDHGRALIGLGRLGEAYEDFASVAKEQIPAGAPPVWLRAPPDAKRELEAISGKVAWLTLSVKGPPEPQVEVDGRVLPSSELGVRHAEDPGERSIVVRASGFLSKEAKAALSAGTDTALEITLLPEPPPTPVVVIPAAPSPLVQDIERRDQRDRTLAYVSFSISGVGLATGAMAGLLWLKARGDIRSACGSLQCEARSSSERARFDDDKHRYDTFGTLSGVGFAVGVAGAAAGLALLLLEPKSEQAKSSRSSVEPEIGLSFAGVRGKF